ncbi:MAG: hydrogenase expression/formation protein HypE [Anaerolineaceae bacterium 4572_78]|nr:MAG: hydrogenase expression/formation protein HypE [Anaerolineaceae bacterium 4572_78]
MKMTKDIGRIVLDHGTGGLLSEDLISSIIIPRLGSVSTGELADSAVLDMHGKKIAVTTDSFSIDPIFFGNGNIGKVSVCGTINDLAVSGATPLYLTLAFIIEEDFPLADFEQILDSVREAAQEAQVHIVAGDTKVVGLGEADKIFVNTTGIGYFKHGRTHISPRNIRKNDNIIVTGLLGNHSIHILSIREGLGFESRVLSDCAPLNGMIAQVLEDHAPDIHFMRDLTRGGLGSVLSEVVALSGLGVEITMDKLPMQYEMKMAADMLGINPIYLANEGNISMFVSPKATNDILNKIRQHPYGKHASVVGHVTDDLIKRVIGLGDDGQITIIEPLYGRELPRLC